MFNDYFDNRLKRFTLDIRKQITYLVNDYQCMLQRFSLHSNAKRSANLLTSVNKGEAARQKGDSEIRAERIKSFSVKKANELKEIITKLFQVFFFERYQQHNHHTLLKANRLNQLNRHHLQSAFVEYNKRQGVDAVSDLNDHIDAMVKCHQIVHYQLEALSDLKLVHYYKTLVGIILFTNKSDENDDINFAEVFLLELSKLIETLQGLLTEYLHIGKHDTYVDLYMAQIDALKTMQQSYQNVMAAYENKLHQSPNVAADFTLSQQSVISSSSSFFAESIKHNNLQTVVTQLVESFSQLAKVVGLNEDEIKVHLIELKDSVANHSSHRMG